ncbi:AAA family ATPase [Vibrio panuliri]|uniref:AAA family ATPase n=1 Tax=Vibrio panuliri TaxID=1381081 RepID=A0A1Q9HFE8_9VIBR|nr:ATP-binding protein [Vibrio panuliri]OLQ88462.1 AAA family ATPase [Vibrio panuliri]
MATLTLIRGLPGSGKSTLARTYQARHFEADMYFVNANGEYCFDASQLEQAHRWCRQQTESALRRGENVVVSNTFVRRWEIKPYYQLAKKFDVRLEVIECHGNYGSVHGVEQSVIERMRARWQVWQSSE